MDGSEAPAQRGRTILVGVVLLCVAGVGFLVSTQATRDDGRAHGRTGVAPSVPISEVPIVPYSTESRVPEPARADRGSVSILVVDSAASPVPSAYICVTQDRSLGDFAVLASGVTDANGVATVSIEGAIPGRPTTVSASAAGYIPGAALLEEGALSAKVTVEPGAELRLVLTWPDGTPAVGAEVTAYGHGYDTRVESETPTFRTVPNVGFQSAVTGPDGAALFRGLGRGPWHMWLGDGWRFDDAGSSDTRYMHVTDTTPGPLKFDVARYKYAVFSVRYADSGSPVWGTPSMVSFGQVGDSQVVGGVLPRPWRGNGRFAYPLLMRTDIKRAAIRIRYDSEAELLDLVVPLVAGSQIPQSSNWPSDWPVIEAASERERGRVRFLGPFVSASWKKFGITPAGRPAGSRRVLGVVATSNNGVFEAELPTGEYGRAVTYDSDIRLESARFVVEAGQVTEVSLRPSKTPMHRLRIAVRNEAGRCVRNAHVRILTRNTRYRWQNDPRDSDWPVVASMPSGRLFDSGAASVVDLIVLASHPEYGGTQVETTLAVETTDGVLAIVLPRR